MKNKRMKLTALAMSVLMAMSTITSVTWAADLFTDGAPAEVEVEAPAEVMSDVETDEVTAGDSTLLTTDASVQGLTDVVFSVNSSKVMVSFKVEGESGTKPEGDGKKYTSYDVVKGARLENGIQPASCTAPERAIYSFTYDGCTVLSSQVAEANDDSCFEIEGYTLPQAEQDAGYIITPGSQAPTGHGRDVPGEKVIRAATCTAPGVKAVYTICNKCKKIHKIDGSGYVDVPSTERLMDDYTRSDPLAGYGITYEEVPMVDHVYDGQTPIIASNEYIEEQRLAPDSIYGGYYQILNARFRPVNCKLNTEGEIIFDDVNSDAYYYEIVKCKYCGVPKEYKTVVLHDVTGISQGTFYEQKLDANPDGNNVLGFYGIKDGQRIQILFANCPQIPVDRPIADVDGPYDGAVLTNPVEPILENCGKVAFYYIRTYDSDSGNGLNNPISEKIIPVNATHSWSSVEVAPSTIVFDGVASATEDDKILHDPVNGDANGFVVVRDATGNVTDVKSINCVTRAKYQLYKECERCGAKVKVGDVKTSGVNKDRHQWSKDWYGPDPEDNVYVKIDAEIHKVYTYKNRYCELCGERDLKLDEEYTESHKLIETRVEDGPSQDPTCGENGYYTVQLICPCGFADEESTKQTVVPATDKHEFGDNPAELQIIGTVQVGGRTVGEPQSQSLTHIIYAQVVRKCTVCGKYDSNGIDNEAVGGVGGTVIIDTANPLTETKTFSDYVPAKADPTTHVPYPCSVGKITVNFKWEGKVDGKATRLTGSKTVPYYINDLAYAGARAHDPGEAKIENKVDATAETAGSYDKVIYCRVCGDEISRETKTITFIPAPTVKAKAANYNTINLTWNAVEGATSYDVYYRSAALGVNDWTLAKNITGTSFNYSGLITGVKYRFTVSAVVGENSSEFGVNTSVATPKLAAPEIKTVTAVKKGTKITWTKVDGANGYIIQSKTASGKWTRVGTVKKGAKVSWTDKKAASGTTYRVRAYRTVDAPNISKNNVYGPFSAAK